MLENECDVVKLNGTFCCSRFSFVLLLADILHFQIRSKVTCVLNFYKYSVISSLILYEKNMYPNREGTALLSISIEGIRGRGMWLISLLIKFTNRVLQNKRKYLQIKPRSCIILIILCFLSFLV